MCKTFRMRIIFIMRSETSNAKSKIRLALTCLEARSSLIDDVNAALAANELAVTMTSLERLERILDLHVNHRSWLAHRQDMPPGCIKQAPKAPIGYRQYSCPKGWPKYTIFQPNVNSCAADSRSSVLKILPQRPDSRGIGWIPRITQFARGFIRVT